VFKIFSTYICSINIQNATLEVSGAVRPLYGVVRRQRVKTSFRICLNVSVFLPGEINLYLGARANNVILVIMNL